jgi:hypothetical protein
MIHEPEEKTELQNDPEPSSNTLPFEQRVEKLIVSLKDYHDIPAEQRAYTKEDIFSPEYRKLLAAHQDPKLQEKQRRVDLLNNLLYVPEELSKGIVIKVVDISQKTATEISEILSIVWNTQFAKNVRSSVSSDVKDFVRHVSTAEWYKQMSAKAKSTIVQWAHSLVNVTLPQYNIMVPELADKAQEIKYILQHIFIAAKQHIFSKKQSRS